MRKRVLLPELSGAQRLEAGTHFLRKKLRLLPGGEVTALRQLVVMDQLGIGPLRPAPRSRIKLVGEHAHRNRDGDAPDGKEWSAPVLPVQTAAGNSRVREPGDRDVVEHVIACEAL